MVCSACAFENQPGMRFCGMCGMPLPQRPITAPGAHSTLNFTRVPLDPRAAASTTSQQRGGVMLETAGGTTNGNGDAPSPVPSGAVSAVDSSRTPASAPEPPPKELVPDVPLDEYVQKFRYEPPKDPSEITMRGDEPVNAPVIEPAKVEPSDYTVTSAAPVVSSSVPSEGKPPFATMPAATSQDVDSRLGLEPETPSEARIARPRFLDINEPPKDAKIDSPKEAEPASSSGTSISGPSFLGLNDTPQTWAAAVGVEDGEYAPRNYHWRAWFAVAVVLTFVGLGVLEWRSQVNQTDNGPVEVIRTKFRKISQSAMSQITGEAVPARNDNSKPEMQVQEQPRPQQSTAAGAANPGSSQPQQPADQLATNPDASSSAQSSSAPPNAASNPGTTATTPDVSPLESATDNSAQPTTAAAKPPAKRQADKSADSEPAAKPTPGADEMTKAKNASDSAAEAAWLWKATAKGNPDAPVQLADMYIQGDGVPRSCEQAVVLLKTAAEKENARARNRLASMYSTGICVPRNRVEAYRWLSSALTANPNSQWAQQNRDLIWQQMTPDERAAAARYR